MSIWLYIMAAIVVLCLLLVLVIACTKVTVNIFYSRKEKYDHVSLEFLAWFRLIRFYYELPVIKLVTDKGEPHVVGTVIKKYPNKRVKTKGKLTLEDIRRIKMGYQKLLKRVMNLKPIVTQMMRRVHCDRLEWHTVLGAGEANTTGTLTGIVWGIKNVIFAVIGQYITLNTVPKTSVQPLWNEAKVQTELRCSLRFRLGYALIAGGRILLNVRKEQREEKAWQNTPSKA